MICRTGLDRILIYVIYAYIKRFKPCLSVLPDNYRAGQNKAIRDKIKGINV